MKIVLPVLIAVVLMWTSCEGGGLVVPTSYPRNADPSVVVDDADTTLPVPVDAPEESEEKPESEPVDTGLPADDTEPAPEDTPAQ